MKEVETSLADFARPLDLPPFPVIESDYLPDNVLVHFHFGPHALAEHFDGAKVLLRETDIYIPEMPGWDEKRLRDVRAISKGNQKPLDQILYAQRNNRYIRWTKELLTAVASVGKWKPITFIDCNSTQEGFTSGHSTSGDVMALATEDLDKTLHNYADNRAETVRRSGLRDRLMVENLGQAVTEIVTGHPKLRAKPQVSVLLTLGFLHQPIYDYLSSHPVTADRVVASMWSGMKRGAEIEDRIACMYRDGESPSKQQMIELMVTYALQALSSPAVKGEGMYSPYRAYTRRPDAHMAIAKTAVTLIGEDKEGQSLALKMLNGNYTPQDKEELRTYLVTAAKTVIGLLENLSKTRDTQ